MYELIWLSAGVTLVVLLYLAWKGCAKVYERYAYTPEERWRRRYDRRLKKHFKSL